MKRWPIRKKKESLPDPLPDPGNWGLRFLFFEVLSELLTFLKSRNGKGNISLPGSHREAKREVIDRGITLQGLGIRSCVDDLSDSLQANERWAVINGRPTRVKVN
ncbi:MAG: hypothetical protein KG012_09410 [Deltaproteobacteria bacterium]|nr:hypothetical protein [Deltaproteobacteria bacterium]